MTRESRTARGETARPRCAQCSDLIGVYEPIMARGEIGFYETSLAADPELRVAPGECYHAACFQAGRPTDD